MAGGSLPRRDGHSSGTRIAARLEQPTRTTGLRNQPLSACAESVVPIRSCSRWGLPCRPRCRVRGALLPHLFTLTDGQEPKLMAGGGSISVALSLGSPPPDVIRHRVSVEPGLSSPASGSGRPADWRGGNARWRGRRQAGKAARKSSPHLEEQPKAASRRMFQRVPEPPEAPFETPFLTERLLRTRARVRRSKPGTCTIAVSCAP